MELKAEGRFYEQCQLSVLVSSVYYAHVLYLSRMSKWGGGAKCPKCGKTVYMAEEVLAEGHKWHKLCFKCSECGKMLDR